jgi:competence protein ComEC
MDITRITLTQGHAIRTPNKEAFLTTLSPDENLMQFPKVKTNDQSIVLQLIYKNIKVLLAGDAEELALSRLLRYGNSLKSTLLKVPHHGSYEFEAEETFLNLVRPEAAVISEAERNRFHLPSPKTVASLNRVGSQVFQTGFTGAVDFRTDGSRYRIETLNALTPFNPP